VRSQSRSQGSNPKGKLPSQDSSSLENHLEAVDWSSALDAMPWAISVHASDGRILHANSRALDISGLPVEIMLGASCEDLFHSDISPCPHEMVLSTGQSSRVEWKSESGEALTTLINPTINAAGEVAGFVRVTWQQTDTQQTAEGSSGVSPLTTLGQMMSVIAHDVGTPLNIILGYTEYLLLRTKDGAPGHKELCTIQDQTKRIANSIRQVLDLGRPAQRRTDAIGLKGFLDESIAHMSHPLRRAQVTASVTCTANSPLIYGDARRLRQAFINLLVGASQRIGPGGRLEVVLQEPENDAGHVVISVIGMEAGGRGHNFGESLADFLNSTTSMTDGGTGLFLAREILCGLGAQLDARDVGSLGTALTVLLPRTMDNETPGSG
jgi:signal transduction histidine kinase